jgi:hypothetical protein
MQLMYLVPSCMSWSEYKYYGLNKCLWTEAWTNAVLRITARTNASEPKLVDYYLMKILS